VGKPDVIAAVATAPGRGAIGVVRISGPDLTEMMAGLFGRMLTPRLATVTKFLDGRGNTIDSGIGLYFQTPRSYTGEDVLELQGHGGSGVLRLVLGRCLEMGARLAQPGEFTRRAFLNGKIDLAQAESVADLIEASSESAARAAIRSLNGAFSDAVDSLQLLLLQVRTQVEAQIDFPEDPIGEFEQSALIEELTATLDGVRRLLDQAIRGRRLRDGIKVAIIGAPNVGKSTLLNCLAGDTLAIVTDIPGTTRDAIAVDVTLAGMPVTLVDTAGIRQADDPVEKIGVQRALDAAKSADIILNIRDTRLEPVTESLQAWLPRNVKQVPVLNKVDLLNAEDLPQDPSVVCISAKTGQGIDKLCQVVLDAMELHDASEANFIARERHVFALQEAIRYIESARDHEGGLEFVAEELRLASVALGGITGQLAADDLLGHIFSSFCIGK